jgi:hypothetical protein
LWASKIHGTAETSFNRVRRTNQAWLVALLTPYLVGKAIASVLASGSGL